jgi:hypothetical protein
MTKSGEAKLKDLPKSDDKFWNLADKHIKKTEYKKCKHVFERRSGREVGCFQCGLGYFLSGKEHLKNGHIYIGKKFII